MSANGSPLTPGWKYYLVFTVCSMTNALFFYVLFPETSGRTLEEMDALFRTMKIIVPLDRQAEHIGMTTREQQLAGGFPQRVVTDNAEYGAGPKEEILPNDDNAVTQV